MSTVRDLANAVVEAEKWWVPALLIPWAVIVGVATHDFKAVMYLGITFPLWPVIIFNLAVSAWNLT